MVQSKVWLLACGRTLTVFSVAVKMVSEVWLKQAHVTAKSSVIASVLQRYWSKGRSRFPLASTNRCSSFAKEIDRRRHHQRRKQVLASLMTILFVFGRWPLSKKAHRLTALVLIFTLAAPDSIAKINICYLSPSTTVASVLRFYHAVVRRADNLNGRLSPVRPRLKISLNVFISMADICSS